MWCSEGVGPGESGSSFLLEAWQLLRPQLKLTRLKLKAVTRILSQLDLCVVEHVVISLYLDMARRWLTASNWRLCMAALSNGAVSFLVVPQGLF